VVKTKRTRHPTLRFLFLHPFGEFLPKWPSPPPAKRTHWSTFFVKKTPMFFPQSSSDESMQTITTLKKHRRSGWRRQRRRGELDRERTLR